MDRLRESKIERPEGEIHEVARHVAEGAGAERPVSAPCGGEVARIEFEPLRGTEPFVPVDILGNIEFRVGIRFGIAAPALSAPDVDFLDFAD